MGKFDRTIEEVESVDDARFGSSAHTSGAGGGHDIYLRKMAMDGVRLLGPVTGGSGHVLAVRTNLLDILQKVDEYPVRWKKNVDTYVERNGIRVPPDDGLDPPRDRQVAERRKSCIAESVGSRYFDDNLGDGFSI